MILTERIYVHPKYFTKKLPEYLKNMFIEKTKDKCSKEYGYILEVKELISFEQHATACGIVFSVSCEVENFKPEKGQIVSGEICWLCDTAILVYVKKLFKMVIPLKDTYIYNKDNNTCTPIDKTKPILVKDMNINVKITSIDFDDNKFKIMGNIV